MISKQKINYLKGKREYFKNNKERLRRLDLEEKDAWKDDLCQPSDSRFRTLYPKSHNQMENAREQVEQDNIRDKANRDTLLHKFRHNSSEKRALINLFNKEDGRKYNSK